MRLPLGHRDRDLELPARIDLADRPLHHHRIGEVDEHDRQATLVLADGNVHDGSASDLDARPDLPSAQRTALAISRP